MPLAVGALSLMLKKKHTHTHLQLFVSYCVLSFAGCTLPLPSKKKTITVEYDMRPGGELPSVQPPKKKTFFFKCAFIPIRMLSMLREITGRIFHSHSLRSFLFNREEKSVAAYAATS